MLLRQERMGSGLIVWEWVCLWEMEKWNDGHMHTAAQISSMDSAGTSPLFFPLVSFRNISPSSCFPTQIWGTETETQLVLLFELLQYQDKFTSKSFLFKAPICNFKDLREPWDSQSVHVGQLALTLCQNHKLKHPFTLVYDSHDTVRTYSTQPLGQLPEDVVCSNVLLYMWFSKNIASWINEHDH